MQAHLQAVNLSASALFKPEFASMKYLTYGAAVSEASFYTTLFCSLFKVQFEVASEYDIIKLRSFSSILSY